MASDSAMESTAARLKLMQARAREDVEQKAMKAKLASKSGAAWGKLRANVLTPPQASIAGAATSFQQLVKAAGEAAAMDDAAIEAEERKEKAARERERLLLASILHVEVFPLMMYIILLGLLSLCIMLTRASQYDYYFSEMVRENVLRSEMDPADTEIAKTFEDVSSLEDVFMFLRGPLLAALFVETSYSGRPLPPHAMRRVNEQSVLVGSIRLQQVRVRPGADCSVLAPTFADPAAPSYIAECYGAYSRGAADAQTIVGASKAERYPWLCAANGSAVGSPTCAPNQYEWKDRDASGLGSFTGWHGWYDGSGYAVTLPSDLASAKALIQTLEADSFLGPGTRALWVDFALYNPSINRFCLARLLFERLDAGSIAPSASIKTYNLLWYDYGSFPMQLVPEACLFLFVLFFIYLELRTMRRQGLRTYWSEVSNYYDWPSLLAFGLIGFLRYKTWRAMDAAKGTIRADGADNGQVDGLVNFQEIAWWAEQEQTWLALDTMLVYLKVLHFLAGVPHISNLLNTLGRARVQLGAFLVCLVTLLVAFAASFHLSLGVDLADWRGVGHSVVGLLRFVLGDVDVPAILRANGTLGSLLFLGFLFLVYFVGVSIFLAIVTSAYSAERAAATKVDLPKVLVAAARRQVRRTRKLRARVWARLGAPRRVLRRLARRVRRRRRRGRRGGRGRGRARADALEQQRRRTRRRRPPSGARRRADARTPRRRCSTWRRSRTSRSRS